MGLGVEQKEGCTRISIDSLIPQKCRATQCPMVCGVRGGCLSWAGLPEARRALTVVRQQLLSLLCSREKRGCSLRCPGNR